MLAVLFLQFAGRLVQLQGFKSRLYATAAEQQRLRSFAEPATRGQIRDRSGNVLAVDVAASDIYVQPPKVGDVAGEAAALAAVLHKPLAGITAALAPGTTFRYLAYDVDPAGGSAG